jgi:FixJ family two-component response regulator
MVDDSADPTVFVIDDNKTFRESVHWLIASIGLTVELYDSANSFLDNVAPGRTGCVVADVRMPGASGLELQVMLGERGIALPVIIMTAHGDVAMAVRAMKQGAFDFVQKPFNDQVFLDLVQKAIGKSVQSADRHLQRAAIRARMDLLTPREREVMDLVAQGATNKRIAVKLGISEKTVEAHRAKVMDKIEVKSLAELIRTLLLVDQH